MRRFLIKNSANFILTNMVKHESDSRINSALPLGQNEESITVKEKPAIAQEVLHNVYFKTSSETSADCVKRICSLISSSQQKLRDYQSRHKCYVKWGSPISINRQTKESLLKGPIRNSRSHVQFRKPRVITSLPSSDQFDFNSSSDSDNNVASRNDSDEEWNVIQEKGRSKRVTKRKAPLNITRTQQAICPKQKKAKANIETHGIFKDNQFPNDLTNQNIQDGIKSENEANLFEHINIPDSDKDDISLISSTDPLKLQSKSKSFRKPFQLTSNLLDDPSNAAKKNSFDEVICLKRPMMEHSIITTRDSIPKKKKLSGSLECSQTLKGSQDLFADESDLPVVNESDQESSQEKSRDDRPIPLENQEETQSEGILDKNITISTERCESSNISEVSIIDGPDIQCPMCNHYFPRKEIERHAYDCNGPPPIPEDVDAAAGRKLRNYSKRQ